MIHCVPSYSRSIVELTLFWEVPPGFKFTATFVRVPWAANLSAPASAVASQFEGSGK